MDYFFLEYPVLISSLAAGVFGLIWSMSQASLISRGLRLFFSENRQPNPSKETTSKLVRYKPSQNLHLNLTSLPLFQYFSSLPNATRFPFYPESFESVSQEHMDSTLLRGRLLYHERGIAHGIGMELSHAGGNPEEKTILLFIHLGDSICGHKEIVHGGLIAALFDDLMGLTFYKTLGVGGFTANLNVNYRAPMPANHTILFCVKITERKGRKVYLTAQAFDAESSIPSEINSEETEDGEFLWTKYVERAESTLYSEATSLFILPRSSST